MADMENQQQARLDIASCRSMLAEAARLEANNEYDALLNQLNRLIHTLESYPDFSPLEANVILSSYAFRAVVNARFINEEQPPTVRQGYTETAYSDLHSALSIDPSMFTGHDPQIIRSIVQSYEFMAEASQGIAQPVLIPELDRQLECLQMSAQAYSNGAELLQELIFNSPEPDTADMHKLFQLYVNKGNVAAEQAALTQQLDIARAAEVYAESVTSTTLALNVLRENLAALDTNTKHSINYNRALSELIILISHRSMNLGQLESMSGHMRSPEMMEAMWSEWAGVSRLPWDDLVEALFMRSDARWFAAARRFLDILYSDMDYLKTLRIDERCQVEYISAIIHLALDENSEAINYCEATINLGNECLYQMHTLEESPQNLAIIHNTQRLIAAAHKLKQDIAGDNSGDNEMMLA